MAALQDIFSNIWAVVLMVFFFGASIFVHELGHFLAARWRGMKVERFSIGFGPKIFGWTGRDSVDYRVAWIPLGGYVLLPQMADMGAIEGEAKTDASRLPPVSYSSKVITLCAGAFFNILFAFALATIVWAVGIQVSDESQSTVVGAVYPTVETSDGKTVTGPASAAGIKPGDTILAVDGHAIEIFPDIFERIALGSGRGEENKPEATLTIKRDNVVSDVTLYPVLTSREAIRDIGIGLSGKIVIEKVFPDSAASAAGLKEGDRLVGIDDRKIQTSTTLSDHIAQTKGAPVLITYVRDGKEGAVTVTPRYVLNQETQKMAYMIGINQTLALTPVTIHIPPWKQVGKVMNQTRNSIGSMANRNSNISLNKMSGPLGIIKLLIDAAKNGFMSLLVIVVLINVSLAIFNMLPIPVLDGGHILFATIEKLRGRPLPPRVLMTAQSISMLLILSLILYVSFFDVRRIIPQSKPAATAGAAAVPEATTPETTAPTAQQAPAK